MKTPMEKVLAAIVAAIGLTAFAAPTVEITKVETPENDSIVNCSYTVSGLEGKDYDLVIKVSAKDAEKGAVSTSLDFESVAEGAAIQTIDCKAVLGKAYPNVTFYATLKEGKEPWQKPVGVQLWDGGPYWADRNLGAANPEEDGWYFWWGDTEGYVRNAANDGWVSAKDGKTTIQFSSSNTKANKTYSKSASQLKSAGWTDSTGNLAMTHDAARVNLGGKWRMPTDAEITDLLNNTTTTWKEQNGVYGHLVTSKTNGKSIFFPAAGQGTVSSLMGSGEKGYILSSTPNTSNTSYVKYLYFVTYSIYRSSDYRYRGFTVRPVQ